MWKSIILFSLSFFSIVVLNGQNAILVKNNTTVSNSLETIRDRSLQAQLSATLNKDKKLSQLIKKKKLAIGIIDLNSTYGASYAAINGNEMMYAASLPKIAILLTAMEAIDKGELIETPEVTEDMNLMIRKSNNAASTRMIDRVGYKKIAEVMTSPKYQFYNKKKGGGLWVGKRYAAAGARNPDPLKGLSHAATVESVCKYYYMLANGALVSPARSEQMKKILVNPGLHHKFVNTLDKVAPRAKVYRKSGSWSTFHSDSVWVNGPERNYILVALVEDGGGEQIIRNLVELAEKAMNNNKVNLGE